MGRVPRARDNAIEIEYETFGDPEGAPLLLIAGLGVQMISWDERFCELLAGRGFYVIRFDNRDSGLSSWMDAAGAPHILDVVSGEVAPPYRLEDMADDAVGLLDGLGIRAAHIVGASMGGYIAQLVAINHPERALTLTSIMSGPGGPDAPAPTPEAAQLLILPPAATREERIEQGMWGRKLLKGSADPYDEDFERARVARAIDRAYNPAGSGRQLAAVLVAPSRLERLKSVRIPTLVIHGVDDILVPIENGRQVAAAVPGSHLVELEGMGHNLPERVWPQVADAIADLARQSTPSC
jgi:pimeloyl-ACP methyl ester carboxylesterase